MPRVVQDAVQADPSRFSAVQYNAELNAKLKAVNDENTFIRKVTL